MDRLREIGVGVPSQELGGLPETMNIEIFSWLSAKKIFICRCVCRTWYHLLSEPYFVKLHHSRSPTQLLLQCRRENNELVLAELDENLYVNNPGGEFNVTEESIIDLRLYESFPNPDDQITIHHSYNATGCILLEIAEVDLLRRRYYVYNPLKKQFTGVHNVNRDRFMTVGCVLGYCERVNQLKLLRFYSKHPLVLEAEMQIIHGYMWRDIPCPSNLDITPSAPFVNGRYHWLDESEDVVHSFEFEEEVFRSFRSPEFSGDVSFWCYGARNIVSLEGRLHFVFCGYWTFELWVLNDYTNENSWTIKYVIADTHDFNAHPNTILYPIRCLKNGDILMRRSGETVVGCNLHTRRQNRIRFFQDGMYEYSPFSYTPSFLGVPPRPPQPQPPQN